MPRAQQALTAFIFVLWKSTHDSPPISDDPVKEVSTAIVRLSVFSLHTLWEFGSEHYAGFKMRE